jgi:hypothetical protein
MDIDFRRVASARQPRDFLGCAEPQMAGWSSDLVVNAWPDPCTRCEHNQITQVRSSDVSSNSFV